RPELHHGQLRLDQHRPSPHRSQGQAGGRPGRAAARLRLPDPYLQFYLRSSDQQAIAQASVGIQHQLNDTLQQVYTSAGWSFASVDRVFATDTPLDQTTNLDPYGQ